MARSDFEDILDAVKTIMVDNLNTKLLSISSDKADSIVLAPIENAAYFLQSLDEEIANFDPFVAYGIMDINSKSLGPQTAETIFISVVIVMADNGINDVNRRMFRYARALKEIYEENWHLVKIGSKIRITRSTVVPFEALDSSATYKAVGIEIETSIA